jgi:hypothetical protein
MPAISSRRAVQAVVTIAGALLATENPLCVRSRDLAWICSPPRDPLQPVHAVGRTVRRQDDTAARCSATPPDVGLSWQPAGRR